MVEKRRLIPLLKQARDADVKAVLIRDKLFIGGVAYGGGSIQVAIENAKKQKKKSIVLSNNENGVNNSQVNSGSAYNVSENAMQIALESWENCV